jgi:hypothetical protein
MKQKQPIKVVMFVSYYYEYAYTSLLRLQHLYHAKRHAAAQYDT